ncbi:alkylated DNA repair protein alkB homolog 8 isoform X2 [Takifugu flavidus]|uniref:alkylated DNA repair protein alkB homolog 8 isoform X2 n=1 Tax=Takifugu flavidus TaxID=433684 RepID=UPI002544BEAB|nr:alkylated DNA repair protein alkB homolog 8 isoform X2 [Takifugu flavidus]
MADTVKNTIFVKRSKVKKKILRKQLKASHILLKHEGISTVSQPTKSLVVANGGLGNGVSRQELSAVLKEFGEIERLVMPPQKPYAFVTYRSEAGAQKAHAQLNGKSLKCEDNVVTLYLSYVQSVPCEEAGSLSLPVGLTLLDSFVSPEEEALLLAALDWSPGNDEVTGIPAECLPILERCLSNQIIDILPDQLTVNQYESGQGIPPHIDTHSAFEETILSLSLGAQTVMDFRHPDGGLVALVLPGRSLLVMKGESRYLWTHGITPRKCDVVPSCDPQSSAPVPTDNQTQSRLTLSRRGTRTSFTFRRIRHEPCRCGFPSVCDSQRVSAVPEPSLPSLPTCHADAAHLEKEYVHRVYNSIAPHFSSTRHSPWPRVCHFLSSLPPGSMVADVGCGNGKYLSVNPEVIAVGCDRSSALIQICAERGFQVFVSDALMLPLHSASFDACISIAVIHHFSTQERRLAAVRELVRLLKPGGQALIYVWAYEQEYNKQRSKYLKEQSKEKYSMTNSTSNGTQDLCERSSQPLEDKHNSGENIQCVSKLADGKLSIHTNRTAFKSQDLLVPWHLKDEKIQRGEYSGENLEYKASSGYGLCSGNRSDCNPGSDFKISIGSSLGLSSESQTSPDSATERSSVTVFHRYYHLFQQGELEHLCGQITGVKVESSYHDQGNWCVLVEKTA